jgi:hypothetical protein
MPCPICKDEGHLAAKCPELVEDLHAPTSAPNKDTRHDDGGGEDEE